MHVLIIGGTGFIGPYVARELSERGLSVTVYHRGNRESALVPSSVRHFRSPSGAMPVLHFPPELLHSQFEIVIHMIAMGESDARAAVKAFTGRAQRLVALSSGDVYLAYGRFSGLEPGEPQRGLLTEDSPLRHTLYPYRAKAKGPEDLSYYYEKILVEQVVLGQRDLPTTVLRLPKVYGPEQNADLATVYEYRDQPDWRWTHGYVENVASAIVLAALHPAASHRVYNVGETYTPTIAERLQNLPPSNLQVAPHTGYDFRHDIAYDTTRIRTELGYKEPIPYEEGLKRTVRGTVKIAI
jgi:nucleoside-diphosphate-sugar epimerase